MEGNAHLGFEAFVFVAPTQVAVFRGEAVVVRAGRQLNAPEKGDAVWQEDGIKAVGSGIEPIHLDDALGLAVLKVSIYPNEEFFARRCREVQ